MKGTYTNEATPPAWELYDLENDPFELKNEYENPTLKTTIQELKNELIKLREDYGDAITDGPEIKNVIQQNW